MIEQMTIDRLLNTNETIAKPLFEKWIYPWEVLPHIKSYIMTLGAGLSEDYNQIAEDVWISKTATVAPSAYIQGPTIIDHEADIRHCAFIRGGVIVGKRSIVGNSTELKNVILFNDVQVPHYNYVGDSILGHKSHMGAGSITSNMKSDKSNITLKIGEEKIETGLRKFGTILGDYVEVGCNAVLNPGAMIGKHSNIYPLSMVRGFVAANSIYKKQGEVVEKY